MEGRMQSAADEAAGSAQEAAERACGLGLAGQLRSLSDASSPLHRLVMRLAADEIDRLRRVVEDYARICQASSQEIKQLRVSTGKTGNQWFTIPPPPPKGGSNGDNNG